MKVVCESSSLQFFCILTLALSFLLFLHSYFPFKQGLEGYATTENVPPEPFTSTSTFPKDNFYRLVLLVIDALRTDFVLGDAVFMPFTRKLLSNGRGVAFSAKTHLPTVTLPRLKVSSS
jgi:predicted AlkP superfamily pyrophosphatase or phosphodiesterase